MLLQISLVLQFHFFFKSRHILYLKDGHSHDTINKQSPNLNPQAEHFQCCHLGVLKPDISERRGRPCIVLYLIIQQ